MRLPGACSFSWALLAHRLDSVLSCTQHSKMLLAATTLYKHATVTELCVLAGGTHDDLTPPL